MVNIGMHSGCIKSWAQRIHKECIKNADINADINAAINAAIKKKNKSIKYALIINKRINKQ